MVNNNRGTRRTQSTASLASALSRRMLLRVTSALAATAAAPSVIRALVPDVYAQEGYWMAGASDTWKKVMDAARKEGAVVVGGPGPAHDAIVQGFNRDTGITVQWLGGSSNEHTARVQTELRAGNVTVDILVGGRAETAFMNQLKPLNDQLLLPKVTDPKYWRGGKIKFCDDAGRYMLQSCEYVSGWPIINTTAVRPSEVVNWADLLQPKFKGRIGAYSPLVPGAGRAAGAYLVSTFGPKFVTDLFLGQQVVYTSDDNQLVEWVARKKVDVGIGSVPASLEQFRNAGFRDVVTPVLPKDAPGFTSGGFSVIKLPQGLPHPNAATVFLNWFVSTPGAQAYSKAMLEASRRTDVHLSHELDYLTPQDGVKYYDAYNEEDYRQRPEQLKMLDAAVKR